MRSLLLLLVSMTAGVNAQTLPPPSIEFALKSNVLVASAPGTFAVEGSLTNNASVPIFLNGTFSSLSAIGLSIDSDPFFVNTPLYLQSDESFSGVLFNINLDNNAAAGSYSGTFSIEGGYDASSLATLGTSAFSVQVNAQPVAEPQAALLLLLGLGAMASTLWGARMRPFANAQNRVLIPH